jgi:PE-PPE domain
MRLGLRPYLTAGIVAVCVSPSAVLPQVPSMSKVQSRAVQLTGVDTPDSPLGDDTALVMGGSTIPIPPHGYLNAVDDLYLQPRDFTGTVQGLDTPEGLYPLSGVHSLTLDTSVAQGDQILDSAIEGQIAGGGVDAANPVVVFGWSPPIFTRPNTTCLPTSRATQSIFCKISTPIWASSSTLLIRFSRPTKSTTRSCYQDRPSSPGKG